MKKIVISDVAWDTHHLLLSTIHDYCNASKIDFSHKVVKNIIVEYEEFDWVSHYKNRISRDQLILDLLKLGINIDDLQNKSKDELLKMVK